MVLLSLGRNREAIECCENALKINPNYPYAYYNKACGEIKEGEIEKALADLDKSFKKGHQLIEWSKKDKDLDSIRTDERFLEIIRKYSTSIYGCNVCNTSFNTEKELSNHVQLISREIF